jgi:hypothetical protein
MVLPVPGGSHDLVSLMHQSINAPRHRLTGARSSPLATGLGRVCGNAQGAGTSFFGRWLREGNPGPVALAEPADDPARRFVFRADKRCLDGDAMGQYRKSAYGRHPRG